MSFNLSGQPVSVEDAISWPSDMPLVNPAQAHQFLLSNAVLGKHRGLLHSHGNSLDGLAVVNCLGAMLKLDPITMEQATSSHDALLNLLVKCKVIEVCSNKHIMVKSRIKNLYQINPTFERTGVLYLQIQSASELLAQDILGTSNPFAKAYLGTKKFSTKTVKMSLDPVWNETVAYVVKADTDQSSDKGASELSVYVGVFSERNMRSKLQIGSTHQILISSMRSTRSSHVNVDKLPRVKYPLRNQRQSHEHIILKAKGGIQNVMTRGLRISRDIDAVAHKATDRSGDDIETVNAEIDYSSEDESEEIGKMLSGSGPDHAANVPTTETSKRNFNIGGIHLRYCWMPCCDELEGNSADTEPLISEESSSNLASAEQKDINDKDYIRAKSTRIKSIFNKNRRNSSTSESTKFQVNPTPQHNAQHRETKFYAEIKTFQPMIESDILPALRQAQELYQAAKANLPTPKKNSNKGDKDDDTETLCRSYLFDNREEVFGFLSAGHSGIHRIVWCMVAPHVGELCTIFNAHDVFDILLNVQFGNKEFESIIRSGQIRNVKKSTFMDYVDALQSETSSLAKKSRKIVAEFPELSGKVGVQDVFVDVLENVRGSRNEQDITTLRKSHYGGKLAVTLDSMYFCKQHMFHENEITGENLCFASQVVESNGTTEYGLMVGMTNSSGTNLRESIKGLDALVTSDDGSMKEFADAVETRRSTSLDDLEDNFMGTVRAVEDAEDEDDDDEDEDDPNSPNKIQNSVETQLGWKLDPLKVKRYVVYRFPLISTKRRNFQLLVLRELIAWKLFIRNVVSRILDTDVVSITSTVGGDTSKEYLLQTVREIVKPYAAAEICSVKALFKIKNEEWTYWQHCNTYLNFGDGASWHQASHFTMYNYVVFSAQREIKKKYEKVHKFAILALHAFAYTVILEAATKNQCTLKYKRTVVEVVESMLTKRDGTHQLSSANSLRTVQNRLWVEYYNLMMSDIIRASAKLKSLGQNVNLMLDILEPVISIGKSFKVLYQKILVWEDPVFTVVLGLIILLLIFSGAVLYYQALITFVLTVQLLYLRQVRQTSGFRKLFIPKKKKRTLMEKYRNLKGKYVKAKKIMWKVNLSLLRLRSLVTWDNEDVTTHLLIFLLCVTLFLAIVPAQVYFLIIWIYVFTKKFRSGRLSRKIKTYIANQWAEVRPAPLWQLEKNEPKQ